MITQTIIYLKKYKGKNTPMIEIAKGKYNMPKWLKIINNKWVIKLKRF